MRRKILEELKKIELSHHVKVLYACESGSRAWGFPSKDSDFDVRFIYIHNRDWYLSIDQKRDVIELPMNDFLDINGWELTKALRLFRKSNPPLLEWLNSGIVYYQAFSVVDKLRDLTNRFYMPTAGIYHYLNMAKRNYRDLLKNDQVKVKKYFNVLRPILACKWIETYNSVPPLLFTKLLNDIIPEGLLKTEINHLIERKVSGMELNFEPRIEVINEYLESEIEHLTQYGKSLNIKISDPTESLNKLFREALNEVWG
ncbi:nucleotidyltransferase domain-containing protein [Heyndrickxia sp. NPDC080065]|uniref:nucleotidyltransferase domain-containing protein n=1 Tax=Heyndrickxia sp. NPDC080065 TaxID=3390568 RepID=UPI003D05E66C